MVLRRATSLRGSLKGVGLENRDFFGPKKVEITNNLWVLLGQLVFALFCASCLFKDIRSALTHFLLLLRTLFLLVVIYSLIVYQETVIFLRKPLSREKRYSKYFSK
jgi:hypothetical protein